jgi:cation diffusion facilitator CzcD-associated flavoprotein CzcO
MLFWKALWLALIVIMSSLSTSTAAMALTNALTETSKIAVIGAGAAGLATARVIRRAGLEHVTVLEKDTSIGGVWNYQEASPEKPMYRGLRTNLPKEIMAYREFPWSSSVSESFLTHRQVLDYLKDYKERFQLPVQLGCTVTKLKVMEQESASVATAKDDNPWPRIQLEWTDADSNEKKDTFDAVCITNGHYSLPQIPLIPGIEHFEGETLHSIVYDTPSNFKGRRVLCIGGRASGADIAREMAEAGASHVYLSDSARTDGAVHTLDGNLSWVPKTIAVREDGSLDFDFDCEIHPKVDLIMFCTGYEYNFPFINETSNLPLESRSRRVEPLYEQLWHAMYPNVAFLGLPHSVIPFPLFEMQAEACLQQWTKCELPNHVERMEHAAKALGGEGKSSGRIADTHYLGNAQWDYCRRMAKYAGVYDEGLESFLATNQVRLWVRIHELENVL